MLTVDLVLDPSLREQPAMGFRTLFGNIVDHWLGFHLVRSGLTSAFEVGFSFTASASLRFLIRRPVEARVATASSIRGSFEGVSFRSDTACPFLWMVGVDGEGALGGNALTP